MSRLCRLAVWTCALAPLLVSGAACCCWPFPVAKSPAVAKAEGEPVGLVLPAEKRPAPPKAPPSVPPKTEPKAEPTRPVVKAPREEDAADRAFREKALAFVRAAKDADASLIARESPGKTVAAFDAFIKTNTAVPSAPEDRPPLVAAQQVAAAVYAALLDVSPELAPYAKAGQRGYPGDLHRRLVASLVTARADLKDMETLLSLPVTSAPEVQQVRVLREAEVAARAAEAKRQADARAAELDRQEKDRAAKEEARKAASRYASRENFERLKLGMSIRQVEGIIGFGQVASRSGPFTTANFRNARCGCIITCVFDGDSLSALNIIGN